MDQGQANITGRLSADPKFFDMDSENKARAVFSIAFNRGRDDNRKSNFVDCIAWGKRAAIMNDFKKGSGIYITAEIEQDTYEAKDGSGKRNRVQFNVRSITATQNLRKKEGASSYGDNQQEVSIGGGTGGGGSGVGEDDIPF